MRRSTWLAMGAIGGALVAGLAGGSVTHLWLGAAVAAACAMAGFRVHERRATVCGLAACLVLLRALAGAALAEPPQVAEQADAAGAWDHEAVVVTLNAPAAGAQKAVIELRPPAPADRVFATLPRYPQIAPGDVIHFGGSLEEAPDDDGFGAYLARSGIRFTTRARTLERLGSDGSPVAALEQMRRAAAGLIAVGLPQPEAGLAGAMSIGLRDLVARDVTADFRVSGLSHVVAISGWHIAMLGAVISGMLGGIGRRPRSLLVLLAIAGYALFAGASPSILRAAVMASVVLLARESGRRGTAAAALSLTVAGMAILDPATINDVGFQLSAAATAGLLLWGSRASEWLSDRLPRRTPRWLVESMAVSGAAQAATLPLVLYHFGSISVVSPFANLLIAPFVAPAMLLTAVAFVCGALISIGVPAIAFAPFAIAGSLVIGAMIALAHFCAALPFATVAVTPPLNLIAAAVCLAGLGWLVRRKQVPRSSLAVPAGGRRTKADPTGDPVRHRRRMAVAGAATALAVLFASANAARADGRLHLTVLDIGQGDSILVEGPTGGRALIDGGPDPDRLIALLDARIPLWDRRIDLVVLTHPHEDHVAGLAAVLDRFRVTEIVEPGMVGPGPGDAAYRRRLTDLGRQSRVVAAGDTLWLDGIRLEVLWPLRGTVPVQAPHSGSDVNNYSIALELRYGARRMLLTGDLEETVDAEMLRRMEPTENGRLDLIKVAHHGSRTATTAELLGRLQPKVALISVGDGNTYGHPAPETLERLIRSGSRVYRTDLSGTIEVTTDGSDLIVTGTGARPQNRPWPSPLPTVPWASPVAVAVRGLFRTYNRDYVHPLARGGGPDPPAPSATDVAPYSFRRRGRHRGVPRGSHRRARPRHQRCTGRGRGAPP